MHSANQTVRRSVMTLTILPGPATSTSYCKVSKRGMVCARLVPNGGVQKAKKVSYLLVPAKQDTHGLTATLSSAPRVYLREAGCLWGDVARVAGWGCLCHALVTATNDVSGCFGRCVCD